MNIKKIIPNILSSVRLLSPVVLIPLIISSNYLVIGVFLIGFFLTDALDGFLARKWHVESELGAKIDAISDKVMLTSFFIPLALNNSLVIVNLVLEALISLVNTTRKLNGVNPKTAQIGRIKMIFISLFMIMSYLMDFLKIPGFIYNSFFSITTLLQTLTLAKYANDAKKEIKDNSRIELDGIENIDDDEILELSEKELTKPLVEEIDLVLSNLRTKKKELIKLREELQRRINLNSQEQSIDKDNKKNKVKRLKLD